MKRLIIIGNGKGAIQVEKKEFIDKSDLVIRINSFKINGYENYVGTKTDICSCSPTDLKLIGTSDEFRNNLCNESFQKFFIKYNVNKLFKIDEIDKLKISYFNIYKFPNVEPDKLKNILYLWTNDKSTIQSYSFCEKIIIWNTNFDQNYTTGFRTILYYLHHFKNYEIYITGFDSFFTSSILEIYPIKRDNPAV